MRKGPGFICKIWRRLHRTNRLTPTARQAERAGHTPMQNFRWRAGGLSTLAQQVIPPPHHSFRRGSEAVQRFSKKGRPLRVTVRSMTM